MSVSIQELDSTVRNFYEGRGEAVSCLLCLFYPWGFADIALQQKQAQTALNQVWPLTLLQQRQKLNRN